MSEIILGGLVIAALIAYLAGKERNSAKKRRKAPVNKRHFEQTRYPGRMHRQPPAEKIEATWYGIDEEVNVQGYIITGGLIYVGEYLPDAGGYANDACLINPKLKVSPANPASSGDGMGYWSQYKNIPGKCRGAYLKWLADGRSAPNANIGYVFLFFYGLERRMLIDGQQGKVSDKERAEIVAEVNRLLRIYGENRSFRRYANHFLAMEWVVYQPNQPIPGYLDLNDSHCSQAFRLMLAKHVGVGAPIPADVAFQWLLLHPQFRLRASARRCLKEFKELFIHRYKQKFGDGLTVKPSKTPLRLHYLAASPSMLGVHLTFEFPDLPDPFMLVAPVKKFYFLAEVCTAELEPYSRCLGRKNNNPNPFAAFGLLPKEIMHLSLLLQNTRSHLAQICVNGTGLISMADLYESAGEKAPVRISKQALESLAVSVETIGFGMAPDIRFHNIKPAPDDKVAIFPGGHGMDFRPSQAYKTTGTILLLGAMVSQIDGDFSPKEEAVLQGLIHANDQLTKMEKTSLLAFLYWCLRTPQAPTGINKKLSEVSATEKSAISHILISVALADGRITPKKIKQLEKLYSSLGLDKKQVTTDIHTLTAKNSEPVTIAKRDTETAFTIPQPAAEKPNGFKLDEEMIRIRAEETDQVRGVLEEIFTPQDEEQPEEEISAPPPAENPLLALDQAHQDLFHRLLEKETWERKALHELCEEYGLMVDGAIEVLNEWAFDHANAPLIEDDELIFIDVPLAKEIANAQTT